MPRSSPSLTPSLRRCSRRSRSTSPTDLILREFNQSYLKQFQLAAGHICERRKQRTYDSKDKLVKEFGGHAAAVMYPLYSPTRYSRRAILAWSSNKNAKSAAVRRPPIPCTLSSPLAYLTRARLSLHRNARRHLHFTRTLRPCAGRKAAIWVRRLRKIGCACRRPMQRDWPAASGRRAHSVCDPRA